MANNELDAVVNLLATDQGLLRSINAGTKGLQDMLKVAGQVNKALSEASKGLAQVRQLQRVQQQAAPNERAVVGTRRTATTIVEANEINRRLGVIGSSNTPSALLQGTIARREQGLPELRGQQRAQAALQLGAAKELAADLKAVEREARTAERALAKIVGPLSPQTAASYAKLKADIDGLYSKLGSNVSRSRFTGSGSLVQELQAKVDQLRALPGLERGNRAAQVRTEEQAWAKLAAAISKAAEAEQRRELKAQKKLAATALKEEERGWSNLTSAIEKTTLATVRQQQATIKAAAASSDAGRQLAAGQTRQRINDNLFGDGGVNFAGRIAQSYGLFQAVNAVYGAVFGTLGVLKDFDAELANLKGIANATSPEMEKLGGVILGVADKSRFSVIELVQASTTLAQAGFSTSEIAASLSGFVQLATASGSTLALSVDVGTAALGSFQLRASDTGRVADVMTSSLNRTKLTMEKLGQGLQYVGTTAYESNLSLEETVALLGGLANSGIRSGSTIGTGLRQFIIDLKDPTAKLQGVMARLGLTIEDINVDSQGLTGVIANLAKAGFSSADAFKGLEVRAAASYLALRNNVPLVLEIERALVLQGAAAKAAESQMNSLSAQGSVALNNLAAIAIKATAPIVSAATSGLRTVNGFFQGINELSTSAIAIGGIVATGAAVGALSGGLRSLFLSYKASQVATRELAASTRLLAIEAQLASGSINATTAAALRSAAAAGTAATAATFLGRAFAFMGGPIGILLTGITLLPLLLDEFGDASGKAARKTEELQTQANASQGRLSEYDQTIVGLEKVLSRLSERSVEMKGNSTALATEILSLSNQFQGLGGMLGSVNISYETLIGTVQRYISIQRQKRADEYVAANSVSDQQINNQSEIVARLGSKYRSGGTLSGRGGGYGGIGGGTTFSAYSGAEKQAADIISGRVRIASDGVAPRKGEVSSLQLSDIMAKVAKSLGENSNVVKDFRQFAASRALISSEFSATQTRNTQREKDLFLITRSSVARSELPDALRVGVKGKTIAPAKAIAQLQSALAGIDKEAADPQNATIGVQAGLGELRNKINDYLQQLLGTKADEIEKAKKAAGAADKPGRAKLFVDRASDSALKALEAEAKLPQNYAEYQAKLGTYDKAAKDFIAAKLEQANDEILKKGLKGVDAESVAESARSDAANRVRVFYAKVGESVSAGIQKRFAMEQAEIDAESLRITAPTRQLAAGIEGQLAGLDKPGLRNKVGDYNRQFLQKQLDEAKLVQNRVELAQLTAEIMLKQQELEEQLEAASSPNLSVATGARSRVAELRKELDGMRTQQATAQGYDQAELPTTFKENFAQAAAVWGESNDAALNFGETVSKNLGGIFDSVGQAGQTFFSSILSGTSTVLGAFGNFAKSMIDILGQLVAKFLVTKLFNFALGALTGGSGGFGDPNATAIYTGGLVGAKAKGYVAGGRVTNGLRSRDSVFAHLAQDEFVTRSAAVDSVGVDFMNDLNKRGAAAVRDRAGVVPVGMGGPPAVTNVYVVLPEEKPQLGPSDILATIHRDIMDGGHTKKLIKSVGAGAV